MSVGLRSGLANLFDDATGATGMAESRYDFTGETVVVTGASSGIGRAVATRFGAAGATVLVGDVREEPRTEGAPTHELIEDAGGRAEFVRTDVSDPGEVRTLVAATGEFGGVDVMVNNAGIFRGARLLDADPDDLDTLLGVNVRGTFVGCQAAAKQMRDRGVAGRIVNTASISSELAQVTQSMYDATKGAVKMVTRTAALELAEHDIRVNAVAPGAVDTEIVPDDDPKTTDADDRTDKSTPLGRAADPADVAGPYLFLASDDARFVTGEMLYVDGGYQVF
jgi:NAD(P)-dependent dehydrogenase (short-subunit alcohol dehydrogenase family)